MFADTLGGGELRRFSFTKWILKVLLKLGLAIKSLPNARRLESFKRFSKVL
jgi:hypothetical protein